MEDYLLKLCKNNRILVSKLKTMNKKLTIRKGRYEEICRENRNRNKCEYNGVGDEYHVLFLSKYRDICRLRN